ncbi:hypothetical protein RclHR1_01490002 [Rhizophagus clarus]|nr:hypothetical protein RclHR1_01490002 [Rhizophagus clarus]
MIRGKIERTRQIYEEIRQFFNDEGLDQFYEKFEQFRDNLGPTSKHVMVRCYGVSQNPTTREYMFVMELERNGDLRLFLTIHKAKLRHCDLHAGNILFGDDGKASLTDLGLSCSKNEQSKLKYGMLPFVAPEILRDEKYTFASDVIFQSKRLKILPNIIELMEGCWNSESSKRPSAIEIYNTFKLLVSW